MYLTVRKASIWPAFKSCFAANSSELYIFDNVRILYLCCNVKKAKTTAKLSKKNRNKQCSNILMVPSVKSGLMILLLFLTVSQRESGTRRTISRSVSVYNIKIIQSLQLDCSNKEARNRLIRVYRSSF